jgi:hypothetical protein
MESREDERPAGGGPAGRSFGELTVLRRTWPAETERGSVLWSCRCGRCGRSADVREADLLGGEAQDCGCAARAAAGIRTARAPQLTNLARGGRRPRLLTHEGETLTAAQWSARTGTKANTILSRIYILGWSDSEAVSGLRRGRTSPGAKGPANRFLPDEPTAPAAGDAQ